MMSSSSSPVPTAGSHSRPKSAPVLPLWLCAPRPPLLYVTKYEKCSCPPSPGPRGREKRDSTKSLVSKTSHRMSGEGLEAGFWEGELLLLLDRGTEGLSSPPLCPFSLALPTTARFMCWRLSSCSVAQPCGSDFIQWQGTLTWFHKICTRHVHISLPTYPHSVPYSLVTEMASGPEAADTVMARIPEVTVV